MCAVPECPRAWQRSQVHASVFFLFFSFFTERKYSSDWNKMKWVPSQFGTKEMQDRVERCMGTSTERSFRIGFLWLGTQRCFVWLGLVPTVQRHCLRCRVSGCYSAQEVFHVALSLGPSKGLLCARHQPHGQQGLVFRDWWKETRLLILFPGLKLSELDWAEENSMRNRTSEFLFQASLTFTKRVRWTPIWDWSWGAHWGFGCCIASLGFSKGYCRDRLCFSTFLLLNFIQQCNKSKINIKYLSLFCYAHPISLSALEIW